MINTEALKTERPTKPGWYWIRQPGMKLLFKIELKLKNNKLFLSGVPLYGGMAIAADYPLEECEEGTEWMTVEDASIAQ